MVKQKIVKAGFSSLVYRTNYNCGHGKPDKFSGNAESKHGLHSGLSLSSFQWIFILVNQEFLRSYVMQGFYASSWEFSCKGISRYLQV